MNIIKVRNKYEISEFHNIVHTLYQNEPSWIPHIKQEIEAVFNPQKNPYHQFGEVERFILQENNTTIGRVAVFFDKRKKDETGQPIGGMGFFECINNQNAANILFQSCVDWLKKKNIQIMDGPINFGEKNKYWGLMVEGSDKHTVYGQNHHLEYYEVLFKEFGFKTYYNQHVYCKDLRLPYPNKFYERSKRIESRSNISFKHMSGNDFKKYARYFIEVYNEAWKTHHKFQPMKLEQAEKMFSKMKAMLDKRLIWFGFYKDKPICFFIGIPDPNEYLKYIHGNLNLLGKLKFMFFKIFKKPRIVSAMVFGITPKFQKLGLESALAHYTSVRMLKYGYTHVVQTWIGDFNPKMIKVCESFLGSDIYQKLRTYRFLFDSKAKFKPHPIIK